MAMTEDELVLLIESEFSDSQTFIDQSITGERDDAWQRFQQEPYGDEVENRSSVVTSEVRDAVLGAMPQILETFLANDNPVEFEAIGTVDEEKNKADVDLARQETNTVKHVFYKENDGFNILYTATFDALLQKTGVVKVFWDESVSNTREEYTDLTEIEYIQTIFSDDVTVVEHTIKIDGQPVDAVPEGVLSSEVFHDVVLRRNKAKNKVNIFNVPPENFFISRNHNNISAKDTDYCVEVVLKTQSELVAEGIPFELVDMLPTFNNSILNRSRDIRFNKEGGAKFTDNSGSDRSRRMLEVKESYVRVDFDGDGFAELRMVKTVGSFVLENEEVDRIPYAIFPAFLMPHKHYSLSMADMVTDLQLINTVLTRGMLDNTYLQNDNKWRVDPEMADESTVDDLLTGGPNTVVFGRDGSVQALITPFVGANTLPILDYFERIGEERTGISRTSLGLDPEALSDSTNLVGSMILNAAQAKMKLIARTMAETGYREMFELIHELLMKHEDNEKIAEVNGKFVPSNPREWQTGRRIRINVGIGNSDKQQKLISVRNVLTRQEQIIQAQGGVAEGPLTSIQGVYNALIEEAKLTGVANPDSFYRNPETFTPPPQEDETDLVDLAEMELTIEAQNKAALIEIKREQVKLDEREVAVKERELELKEKEFGAEIGKTK